MPNKFGKSSGLMLLTGMLLVAPGPIIAKEKITFFADEWCPYNCQPGSDKPGYLIEMLTKIFPDYDIEYKVLPWERAEQLVRDNRRDNYGLLATTHEDSPNMVFPEVSQGKLMYAFYSKEGQDNSWSYSGPDSLKNKILGMIQNYQYGFDSRNPTFSLNEYAKSAGVSRVTMMAGTAPLENLLRMAELRRVDLVIDDVNVIENTVQRLKSESFLQKDTMFKRVGVFNTKDVFVVFSPKHPNSVQFARRVAEGTKKLRADGTLKKILERYGLQDWEANIN